MAQRLKNLQPKAYASEKEFLAGLSTVLLRDYGRKLTNDELVESGRNIDSLLKGYLA